MNIAALTPKNAATVIITLVALLARQGSMTDADMKMLISLSGTCV